MAEISLCGCRRPAWEEQATCTHKEQAPVRGPHDDRDRQPAEQLRSGLGCARPCETQPEIPNFKR